MILLKFG